MCVRVFAHKQRSIQGELGGGGGVKTWASVLHNRLFLCLFVSLWTFNNNILNLTYGNLYDGEIPHWLIKYSMYFQWRSKYRKEIWLKDGEINLVNGEVLHITIIFTSDYTQKFEADSWYSAVHCKPSLTRQIQWISFTRYYICRLSWNLMKLIKRDYYVTTMITFWF